MYVIYYAVKSVVIRTHKNNTEQFAQIELREMQVNLAKYRFIFIVLLQENASSTVSVNKMYSSASPVK